MKFRLSTLLLFTTLVVVLTCWFAERRFYRKKLSSSVGTIREFSEAQTTIQFGKSWRSNPDSFETIVQHQTLWSLHLLFERRSEIDKIYGKEVRSDHVASAMELLGCRSSFEFRSRAVAEEVFGDTELFPHMLDESSTEFQLFDAFLEDSLNKK